MAAFAFGNLTTETQRKTLLAENHEPGAPHLHDRLLRLPATSFADVGPWLQPGAGCPTPAYRPLGLPTTSFADVGRWLQQDPHLREPTFEGPPFFHADVGHPRPLKLVCFLRGITPNFFLDSSSILDIIKLS